MPLGYFNAVSFPSLLEIKNMGSPNTTCTKEEDNSTTGCVPDAISIPNPYPYPVPPPPPPKPTPQPPAPPAGSNTQKTVIYAVCTAAAVLLIVIIVVVVCKKPTGQNADLGVKTEGEAEGAEPSAKETKK